MCRRNQLLGVALLSFGAGLLVGTLLTQSFFCGCCGIVLIVVGLCHLQRK